MKKWLILPAVLFVTAAVWLVARRLGPSGRPGEELVVYAYSSFAASWGAGPALAQSFETQEGIRVRLIDAGDARALVHRMKLEEDRFAADVVVGFDQYSLDEAKSLRSWHSLELTQVKWAPDFPEKARVSGEFAPFDWSPMAFIYKTGDVRPPQSLDDLRKPEYQKQVSLMDPRTSSPGYQFLEWVLALKGESRFSEFFSELNPSVISYSPSWSAAYGMFKKGEAKLAFSYLTSAAYHWRSEKDRRYQPAVFDEGHPYQVEYAAVPTSCRRCDTGRKFIRFLLNMESQKVLMESNAMLPVIDGVRSGTEFAELPQVKLLDAGSRSPQEIEKYLDLWKTTVK